MQCVAFGDVCGGGDDLLHVVVQWAPSWWSEAENWAAYCRLLSLFAPFFTSVSVTRLYLILTL